MFNKCRSSEFGSSGVNYFNWFNNIEIPITTTCTRTLTVSATGLPLGMQMIFVNNIVTISGTPTGSVTGTFDYSIVASAGGTASLTINGRLLFKPDADNDGVDDQYDKCPDTNPGDTVDENGCAEVQLDADLDGILNIDDICPNILQMRQLMQRVVVKLK